MNFRGVSALFLIPGLVGLGLLIAGFATDYWIKQDLISYNFGLWRQCTLGICRVYETRNVQDIWLWIRVVMSLSLGLGLAGVAANIATSAVGFGKQASAATATSVLYACCGIIAAAGLIIHPVHFRINDNPDVTDYGYSYWLTVAGAGVVLIFGSIFGCVSRCAR